MDVDLRNFVTSNGGNSKGGGETRCTVNEDVMETPWVGREEEQITNKVMSPNPNRSRPNDHNPPPTVEEENNQVELMDHFNKIFVKKTFNSFKEFDELFSQFKKRNRICFPYQVIVQCCL